MSAGLGCSLPRLILVTDPAFGDGPTLRTITAVGRALPRGAFAVQLRDKRRPTASLRMFATELRAATRAYGAPLLVNGRAEVARDAGADGVHLGSGAAVARGTRASVDDARACFVRPAWVTLATHTDAEVRAAGDAAVDAVLVSSVFATRALVSDAVEKAPRGVAAIASARAAARRGVAVYALGGITVDRVPQCVRAGADGVAVIRAVFASADPGRDARAIHDAFWPRS
jgi:thiamine-phosphate pyrophosphorylase